MSQPIQEQQKDMPTIVIQDIKLSLGFYQIPGGLWKVMIYFNRRYRDITYPLLTDEQVAEMVYTMDGMGTVVPAGGFPDKIAKEIDRLNEEWLLELDNDDIDTSNNKVN